MCALESFSVSFPVMFQCYRQVPEARDEVEQELISPELAEQPTVSSRKERIGFCKDSVFSFTGFLENSVDRGISPKFPGHEAMWNTFIRNLLTASEVNAKRTNQLSDKIQPTMSRGFTLAQLDMDVGLNGPP